MSEETTQSQVVKSARLPKNTEEVRAIAHIPTTEATRSFARYVNENLANADNFEPISDEQAWAIIGCHRPWQQGPERAAEKEAAKAANAELNEQKKAEREQKKAERAAEKERKAAEAAKKKAEREAKAAEAGEDLDGVDAEGEGEITKPKRRRRKPNAAAEDTAEAVTEEATEGF